MGFYIHLHLLRDKEFETAAKRDTAMKAIAKVLATYGFVKEEADFQAREDVEFTASDGTKITSLRTVTVTGADLPEPVIEPAPKPIIEPI